MLQPEQIEEIHFQLHQSSNHSTRRNLKKQLQEHEYASTHPAYQPTPYKLVFINRKTTIDTLLRMNREIQQTNPFILDTESVMIKFKPNLPALIQIQIYSRSSSIIMIIEPHHLPDPQQHEFQLIKNLSQSLLTNRNQIFSWRGIDELTKFTRFNLFDVGQIYQPIDRNVQREYHVYWDRTFPHRMDTNETDCKCRNCFGVGHKSLLGLQDVVAFELGEYLNKQLTCEKFNIGLDINLKKLNSNGTIYRKSLTTYAANDCDSILRIILKSNIINDQYLDTNDLDGMNDMMPIDDFPIINDLTEESSPDIQRTTTNEDECEEIKPDADVTGALVVVNSNNDRPNPLSKAERVKIHNRSCSIRQRIRSFNKEIIIYNIDNRFPVRLMKKILKKHNVPVTRVHPTESKYTPETILFVGLREEISTEKYDEIKNFFNRDHFNRIFSSKPYGSNRKRPNTRLNTSSSRHHQQHRSQQHRHHQHQN